MSRYKTGHKQPRFRYSVLARCVAWANISVQVLFPLAVTFTPVMAARAQHAVQPRLSMGNTTELLIITWRKMSRRLPQMPGHF